MVGYDSGRSQEIPRIISRHHIHLGRFWRIAPVAHLVHRPAEDIPAGAWLRFLLIAWKGDLDGRAISSRISASGGQKKT